MNSAHLLRLCLLLSACILSTLPVRAQQPPQSLQRCQPPAPPTLTPAQNIFTHQQEVDLGDAIAERIQRDFRVIEDDEVVGYLRRVGERIVKQLPPSELRYQFFLVDLPIANAFAMPGGRVYISRKLVAFARTEDELAGVLAHELGHIVARQAAVEMTRQLREVLGVQQVTDRRDIFEKYNQLLENAARKPKAFRRGDEHEEKEQLVADLIGLYAMASAGYDPQAAASIWDRFNETKGKTGGFFSDLFGTTKPETRRLREMLRGVAALPSECISARAAIAPTEEFVKWQAAVVNYTGLGRREMLHAVVSKKQLEPPLRGDITHLRFSPDGRYVLAQDDSGVNVLAREPFAPLFRIDAPEAHPAQFTPDSQQIVFYSSGLRVEFWNVAEAELKAAHEMVVRKSCVQTALAPDGKTLVCLDSDFNLTLFDVASGTQVFEKKSLYVPANPFEILLLSLQQILGEGDVEFLRMGFSSDARYFAAGRGDTAIAVDLTTRSAVPLGGQLKKLIGNNFTFIGADRLAGTDPGDVRKSLIVAFPSGEVLEQQSFGTASLAAPTRGNYVMLRPIRNFAVGVVDLATKKIFMAGKQPALDIYGDVYASERLNGELGLYKIEKNELLSKVILPRNPLGRVRAAALSEDLRWLAVSERTRGAVWDLSKGERLFHVRGFRGAYFSDDGALYADFPKFEQTERTVARLDLATRQVTEGPKIEEGSATQYGQFVLLTKPAKKEGKLTENVILEVRDARTGTTMWSKNFPKEAPRVWIEPNETTMVLAWPVKTDAAGLEIKSNPKLGQQLATMKEKEGDYLLQTLDARTGNALGSLLVETGKGSFRISDAFVAGDWVVISDTENRVLVYSLSSGEQKGKMFGNHPVVAKTSGLLSVQNERGQLSVYDLASMERRDQFTFSSPVALNRFSTDGKQLFVLTENQTAYVLNLDSFAQTR